MSTKQNGFLLLDVLYACALLSIIMFSFHTINEHFIITLKISRVRTATNILANDLRKLQRYTMFQCNGTPLTIKIANNSEYRIYDGLNIKKTVNFDKLGCQGVYFAKKLNSSRFMAIGTPSYTGDYELKHKDLPNFSCILSIQPITGRVIISEGK